MNELIRQYKETNNEEIFEKILNKNMGLIYKTVSKYKESILHSYEDMHQICTISLIKAIKNYDENKKIKFTSYFCEIMNRDLIVEICVNQNRKKRKAEVYSLDTSANETDDNRTLKDVTEDTRVNVEEEVITKAIKEFLNECIKEYEIKQPKKYKSVILTLQGYTNRQIESMDICKKSTVGNNWKHFMEFAKEKALAEGILEN